LGSSCVKAPGSSLVKASRKMLVKLTPGVNFINVLRAALIHADPKSVKFMLSLQYPFLLLGSASVKAAQKTLMKLTPDGKILFKENAHSASVTRVCKRQRH